MSSRRLRHGQAPQWSEPKLEDLPPLLQRVFLASAYLEEAQAGTPAPPRHTPVPVPTKPAPLAAGNVPRVRDALVEHWGRSLAWVLSQHPGKLYFPFHRDRLGPDGYPASWTVGEWVDQLRRWLTEAELFYVTADMSTVVRQAAHAMPTYQVYPDVLPAKVGFVVFGDTVCLVDDTCPEMEPGERCEIRAMLWGPVEETSSGPGVMLVTLQDSDIMVGTRPKLAEMPREVVATAISSPVAYHEEYPLPYGNRPWGEADRPVHNTAVAAAMSAWIMMGQKITSEATERAPRALRRQYEREGRPEPTVRTVTLRQASKPAQERQPGQESSRVYRHRWVVGEYGYWRNTWYPSAEEHRLQYVYVPAYVKGPQDAPMIGGERVNVLRR